MTGRLRAPVVAWLVMLASCKRSSGPAAPDAGPAPRALTPAFTVAVLDGGVAAAGDGAWSCEEGAARALPDEPTVGALVRPASAGGASVFTYASSEGGRRHRALELGGEGRALEGPPVSGDAPPWVPALVGDALRLVRLDTASPPRVVVADRTAVLFEVPLALGDELAVDAAGSGATFAVAASSARGVEVRIGAGAKAEAQHVIADAYAPAVLVGPRGAIAVAARVDAPLEPAKVAKDVPTANLEGAGQERVGSTLVVVSATGQRLAAHPLPAGSEVVGVTTTREAIVLAVMRVARGVRSVDVDAVRADGRRERVGTFPVRRAARLYPVAAPSGVPASSSSAAVLEVVDDGVAVLGARAGALPVREVEAVFGAQTEGDSLDVWLLRAREGGRSLVPARCTWRTP